MNKLQKYYILEGQSKDPMLSHVKVIGTNSGQAFVEAAAEKHMGRLKARNPSLHYVIVEVHKLGALM